MKPGFLTLAVVSLLLFSCKKDFQSSESQAFASGSITAAAKTLDLTNGQLKIAVLSDIHYAPSSLFQHEARSGAAYQAYLQADPKLLDVVEPVAGSIIADLKQEQPDLVLVTGDLTKDGEKVSHDAVAALLSQLPGKVFVVPGNHDINNPEARMYDGDNALPTDIIQANDFANIYKKFGYDETSVVRDPASLSYMAKPYSNLWILAIDANRYADNTDIAIVEGRIKEVTMTWIQEQMAKAREQHATVLTMMHHNLVEHYQGQSMLDPGYTVNNWEATANALMEAGVNVIFTGHYHANDITRYTNNGKEVYDIETGSPLLPPSAYRIVTLKNKNLEIDTRYVRSIQADLGGVNFPTYSYLFIEPLLETYLTTMLTVKFGVPPEVAASVAPLVVNAVMTHFAGDEKMAPEQRKMIESLTADAPDLAGMLTTLYTDLGVKDLKTVITYRK